MKDLMNLVSICKAELDSLDIKYGKVNNWTVNSRAKCRFGQCRKISFDLFDINISETVLKDDIDNQIALNTVMHELLHTVNGCFNHGAKWKKYAEYINRKLPRYNIRRVATKSDTALIIAHKEPAYNYILCCTKCGQEIKRQKKTKVVINYKKYRCGKCGGKLERIL